MTNRREFLQIGITAGAWPIASRAARAAGADPDATVPLYKVVYDKRFGDSVAFASRMEMLGVPSHAIEGDVTRFWYDELYHQWQNGPAAIAGLTAHGPLFCLERLAWDQGMRVVFRAEHTFAQGSVDHELSGPLPMLHHSLGLADGAARWAVTMADIVAHCPVGRAEISSMRLTGASNHKLALDAVPLFSWVIAPAARA